MRARLPMKGDPPEILRSKPLSSLTDSRGRLIKLCQVCRSDRAFFGFRSPRHGVPPHQRVADTRWFCAEHKDAGERYRDPNL